MVLNAVVRPFGTGDQAEYLVYIEHDKDSALMAAFATRDAAYALADVLNSLFNSHRVNLR